VEAGHRSLTLARGLMPPPVLPPGPTRVIRQTSYSGRRPVEGGWRAHDGRGVWDRGRLFVPLDRSPDLEYLHSDVADAGRDGLLPAGDLRQADPLERRVQGADGPVRRGDSGPRGTTTHSGATTDRTDKTRAARAARPARGGPGEPVGHRGHRGPPGIGPGLRELPCRWPPHQLPDPRGAAAGEPLLLLRP
jgi:hypothetical protein